MPRSATGVYSKPAGTTAVAGTVISPITFNTLIDDIVTDLNLSRSYPGAAYITPVSLGASGDGTGDDGPDFNLALDAVRAAVAASTNIGGVVILDGQGKTYRIATSINATGISGFNFVIQNMTLLGHCAGKCVLDMVGTRGARLSNVTIEGDATNTPSVGIQTARAASGGLAGYCDMNLWDRVHVDGFFTQAPVVLYGQESTTHLECKYFNRRNNGVAAVIGGYSMSPISSDYMTPITGSTSHINDVFIRTEFRHLPTGVGGLSYAITAISSANPAVITCGGGHSFTNGMTVCLSALGGSMANINSTVGVIQNVTATTFEIVGLDTSALSAYTGSGLASKQQTTATVVLGRTSNTRFVQCYIQAFGQAAINFQFPDSSIMHGVDFEGLLVEGAPLAYGHFTQGSTNKSIEGFRFSTPHNLAAVAMFTLDAGSAGNVALGNGLIRVDHDPYGTRKVILDAQASKFSLPGTDVYSPTIGAVNRLGLAVARGRYYGYDSSTVWGMGEYLRDPVIYGGTITYAGGTAWAVNETSGALTSGTGPLLLAGSGTPEGVVSAPIGSLFMRADGGSGTSFYVKQSGSGSTGWVGK